MKFRHYSRVVFFLLFSLFLQTGFAEMPKWSYDPAPDPQTPMGKELIDLVAEIPNMPAISESVMGDQKFRYKFGPVNWRMLQKSNKVKILFIGQDATHIAEAAGRTATAGYGGRAQDLAAYFGVNEGGAFINTYAFTIYGQYGAFQTPYVYRKDGSNEIRFGSLVDNKLWLITQDQASPIVKWRNGLIDWIIRNNKESIKLIVTFGGAARDSMATFIESKGGQVGATFSKDIKNIQIAESFLTSAGGNNEFPVLANREGQDLYAEMMGRKIKYNDELEQKAVRDHIVANSTDYIKKMVFTKNGPYKNGILHPAQLGGFDLDQIMVSGKKTRSLKGMKLSDGSVIDNEVLVVELPHPTFLSNLTPPEASKAVGKNLIAIKSYVDKGWVIKADEGMINHFAQGEPYKYARKEIGPEYYDFGTPKSRMVSVSSASRMGGNNNVIIFGTREPAKYEMEKIKLMTKALPAQKFSDEELFIARPRSEELRYVFDPGPGPEMAKIMKENLDFSKIFKVKAGKTFEANGIDAYYVKSHPDQGDFGHYRGTFKNPRVVVLADPHGFDDLITSRALTGTRGQHLQRLMDDIGVGDQYLVIKTVPFGMDLASVEDWKYVLDATKIYREKILEAILKNGKPQFIMTDGGFAKAEIARMLDGNKEIKVIDISRTGNHSADMIAVGSLIGVKPSGKMSNIPRSHLTFYARTWEGTSGDRVIASNDKFRGMAFAEVAPAWAYEQKNISVNKFDESDELLDKLNHYKLPMPKEDIPQYLKRLDLDPSLGYMRRILDSFVNLFAA